jgi:hypothetical protein
MSGFDYVSVVLFLIVCLLLVRLSRLRRAMFGALDRAGLQISALSARLQAALAALAAAKKELGEGAD